METFVEADDEDEAQQQIIELERVGEIGINVVIIKGDCEVVAIEDDETVWECEAVEEEDLND